MKVNKKLLNKVWSAISTENGRLILLAIRDKDALTYTELKSRVLVSGKSNLTPYYLKQLLESRTIKKDGRYYVLTKMGERACNMISDFERLCLEYELTDLDETGKILEIRQIIKVENTE